MRGDVLLRVVNGSWTRPHATHVKALMGFGQMVSKMFGLPADPLSGARLAALRGDLPAYAKVTGRPEADARPLMAQHRSDLAKFYGQIVTRRTIAQPIKSIWNTMKAHELSGSNAMVQRLNKEWKERGIKF